MGASTRGRSKTTCEVGTTAWPNGRTYVGGYKNGIQDGYGEFTCRDGSKCVGTFKDGKKEGQAETCVDGCKCRKPSRL